MLKKTNFSLSNLWLEALPKTTSQKPSSAVFSDKTFQGAQNEQSTPEANNIELKRIASALERIALALENLSSPVAPHTAPASVQPSQPLQNYDTLKVEAKTTTVTNIRKQSRLSL